MDKKDNKPEKEKQPEKERQGHNPEYDNLVPNAIFDIEDSDEIAIAWGEMFGY